MCFELNFHIFEMWNGLWELIFPYLLIAKIFSLLLCQKALVWKQYAHYADGGHTSILAYSLIRSTETLAKNILKILFVHAVSCLTTLPVCNCTVRKLSLGFRIFLCMLLLWTIYFSFCKIFHLAFKVILGVITNLNRMHEKELGYYKFIRICFSLNNEKTCIVLNTRGWESLTWFRRTLLMAVYTSNHK